MRVEREFSSTLGDYHPPQPNENESSSRDRDMASTDLNCNRTSKQTLLTASRLPSIMNFSCKREAAACLLLMFMFNDEEEDVFPWSFASFLGCLMS